MKKILLASTSTIHGSGYLEYILPEFKKFLGDIKEVLFIPFARPSGVTHSAYTESASKAFASIGINVTGLHSYENKIEALQKAECIFTGGGNTFLLLNDLYRMELMETLITVVNNGTYYLGTSAGSNLGGVSIHNTNDMPIIYPPTFKACGWLPYNINPHYLDPDPTSKHKGETRETRINEFHFYNDIPVIGIREGNWLEIIGQNITLRGQHKTRYFEKGKNPVELSPNTKLSFIN